MRPPIDGQQKRPDARVELSGYECFAEVKRYSDNGPGPHGRSIVLSDLAGSVAKPRMMALVSKLESVPDQLPDKGVSILFVFHSGYGENRAYIQQALFGDEAFFVHSAVVTPGDNALFGKESWSKISAVTFVADFNGVLHCRGMWQNPKAFVPLPDAVQVVIRDLA